MQTRWIQTVGAAAALALALGGCNEKGSRQAAQTPEGDQTVYRFGVIAKSQSNPVFQAAHTGAKDAAADLIAEYPGVDVQILIRTPADEDAQRQAEAIRQLVSEGVDGITVSCTDAQILTGAINDAVEAGVPVVTFDSDAPDSKRFAYYGVDDVAAGREVMTQLAAQLDGGGVIAVLAGNQTAPNLQARVRGVREAAAEMDGVEVKYVFYHPETAPDAAAKVKQEQQNHPEITGWAMVGGWPLFTTNALDGVYEHAKVVAVDHLPEQLTYVRDGQVQVLVGQDCYGWGYETINMLFDKVHEGTEPASPINTFDLQIVTPDNVEQYEGTWDRWLAVGGAG
ncbi:MAG: substrate-binding domain-containing protein [Phycisphaerales bacterium JB039]